MNRISFRFDHSPDKSAPIPVTNGLALHSLRGPIGTSWWSRRWLTAVETSVARPILDAGRRYARKRQVVSIDAGLGTVSARVQGTVPEPYRCQMRFNGLSADQIDQFLAATVRDAEFAALMFAGRVPDRAPALFDELHAPLFPAETVEPVWHCCCDEPGPLCKHGIAVACLVAERLDDDPFLLFELRGVSQSAMRDYWCQHWAQCGSGVSPSGHVERQPPCRLNDYFTTDIDELLATDDSSIQPINVLERLGFPPFFPAKDDAVVPALRKLYKRP